MKLLLDTHVLLWTISDSKRLSREARRHISAPSNSVFISVVSLWEIALKARLGRLDADVSRIAAGLYPASTMMRLDIKIPHLETLQTLTRIDDHKDPFDHLLICQAVTEDMVFVSHDAWVKNYPVQLIET